MAERHTTSLARGALRTLALPLLGTGILLASTLAPGASAAGTPGQIAPAAQKLPPFQIVEGVELRPAFIHPVQGSYRLTGRFGDSHGPWASHHTGLDFAAPSGTPVRAAAAGTVVSASYDGAYGNKVVLRTAGGIELWFCHLDEMHVSPGDHLAVGTRLGTIGSTGNSTGPHLHLEVRRVDGEPTDPEPWLRSKGLNP